MIDEKSTLLTADFIKQINDVSGTDRLEMIRTKMAMHLSLPAASQYHAFAPHREHSSLTAYDFHTSWIL